MGGPEGETLVEFDGCAETAASPARWVRAGEGLRFTLTTLGRWV